jgi:hypothetical protein
MHGMLAQKRARALSPFASAARFTLLATASLHERQPSKLHKHECAAIGIMGTPRAMQSLQW